MVARQLICGDIFKVEGKKDDARRASVGKVSADANPAAAAGDLDHFVFLDIHVCGVLRMDLQSLIGAEY